MIRLIKSLFKPFAQWILNSGAREPDNWKSMDTPISSNRTKGSSDVRLGDGLNFVVYSAIGGKVIQFSTYDVARDRHMSNLYIITDKEDLGIEIGQIITKESLSR